MIRSFFFKIFKINKFFNFKLIQQNLIIDLQGFGSPTRKYIRSISVQTDLFVGLGSKLPIDPIKAVTGPISRQSEPVMGLIDQFKVKLTYLTHLFTSINIWISYEPNISNDRCHYSLN